MGKRDGEQKGPQQHAEGQHGERTHSRFIEQIQEPMERTDDDRSNDRPQDDSADEDSGFNRQRG
jgi:hypothetical protein